MATLIDVEVPTRPLTDWWARTRGEHQRSNCVCTRGGVCGSMESLVAQIALRTPVSRSTLFRRIQYGKVTMAEADRWACALGQHPSYIWAEWSRVAVTASLAPQPATGRTLF